MAISSFLLRSVPVLSLFFSNAAASYQLQTDYSGASFFDGFNFWSDPDPTDGYVVYNDLSDAQAKNLIDIKDGVAYIYVDSTTDLTVGKDPGRDSIRIQSQEIYNHGLIIADIGNMPGGACGTWPAFWTYGPSWPNNGEIDIIEGVNSNGYNQMTLHTPGDCSTTGTFEFGTLQNPVCTANEGCGVIDYASPLSYGTSFNANNGGVYAMEWTSDWIRVWFFPHGTAPNDIAQGNPDPTGWGEPRSNFQGDCTIDDIFHNHTIVFDTTFCGGWGAAAWDSDPVCGKLGITCEEYVAGFPQDFAEMYWAINSVKVYQEVSGAPTTTSPPAAPTTTTPVVVIPPPPTTTPVVIIPPPPTSTIAPALPTTSIPPIISLPTISSSPSAAPTTIVPPISSSTSSVSGGVFAAVSSSSSSSTIETISSAAPSTSSTTSESSTSSAVPSTTSSSAAPSTTSTTSSSSAASSTSSSTTTTTSSTYISVTSSSSILSNSTSTLAVLSSLASKQLYSNTSSTFSSTTTSAPVYSNFTSAVIAVASTTSSVVSFSNYSSTLAPTTSTSASSPDPTVVGEFVYFGCYGSTDDFASFGLINESPLMTPELCISECASSVYAGIYGEQCWCGNAFTKSTVADAICDISCPGDATEFCGGEIVIPSRMAKRGAGSVLLTLYTNVYNTPGIGCAGGAACLPSGASSLIASSYSSSTTSSPTSSTTAFADSAESSLSSSSVSTASTGDIFFASASSSTVPATSTLTILSTSIYTISSCAATVTDCPYRIGSITTEIITQYTTFCPGNSASPSSPAVGTSTPVPVQSTLTISPLPASSSSPLGTITISPIPLPTSTAQGEVYTTVIVTSYVDICPEGTLSTYSTSQTLTLPVAASSAPSIPFTTTVKSLTIAGSTQVVTLSIPAATIPVSGETGPEGSATISSVLGVKTGAVTVVSVPTPSVLYHADNSTSVKGGVSSTGGVSVPSYSVVPASGATQVVMRWGAIAGAMAVLFFLF